VKIDIQAVLFQMIKDKIDGKDSIGNALSEVLHLSQDAVYRRFRGETALTIHEIQKLCKHFDISFDALIKLDKGQVVFSYTPLNMYDFSLESYLEGILRSINQLYKMKDSKIILSVNNTHFFQLLNFPQLVRFRLFFWAKTHLQISDYKNQQFRHEKTTERAFELGKEILWRYNQITSVEIYDPELMRGFMRQILYYYEAHMLEDPSYALFLCDRAMMFNRHLKDQAEVGKKYIYGTQPPASGNEFNMYLNETINSDTTFYYESQETKGIFITHNIMNFLNTSDEAYVADARQILDKQLANSSIMSIVNEKLRNNFFFETEKMMQSFKRKIEADLDFNN